MHRKLSASAKQALKRKRYWKVGITLALVAIAIVGFRSLITTSILRAEIKERRRCDCPPGRSE